MDPFITMTWMTDVWYLAKKKKCIKEIIIRYIYFIVK